MICVRSSVVAVVAAAANDVVHYYSAEVDAWNFAVMAEVASSALEFVVEDSRSIAEEVASLQTEEDDAPLAVVAVDDVACCS